MNKLNQWRAVKRYSAKLNLLNKIHKAIEPQLAVMRQASDLLGRCTRESVGIKRQGYCCKIGDKYTGHMYRMGQLETDLANENDSFQAVRKQASNQARRDTYQASKH